MYYFNEKLQLMIRYVHIRNKIKRLVKFEGDKYIKYEELILTEVKELLRIIGEDMKELYTKDKISGIQYMNINKDNDIVNFSLLIKNNDCIANDFFISFLVYKNLYKILKHREYHGLDLVDIDNKFDSLLSSFNVGAKDGKLKFIHENVVANYYTLDSKADDNLPHVTFESYENNEGCFNIYYVNNIDLELFNNLNTMFNI